MHLCMLFVVALTSAALPLLAEAGVSVRIGHPGFYGHIDIGGLPPPPLLFPQPIVIHPVPVGIAPPPLYLRVPSGHSRHWHKHCHRYQACGRPVYFVQERWYKEVYVSRPSRGHRHHGRGPHHRGHGRGHKRH